jgi:hypothetical protein
MDRALSDRAVRRRQGRNLEEPTNHASLQPRPGTIDHRPSSGVVIAIRPNFTGFCSGSDFRPDPAWPPCRSAFCWRLGDGLVLRLSATDFV